MMKTLGCLIASMTFGTAVLSWVQPQAQVPSFTSLVSVLHPNTARGAPGTSVPRVSWRRIVIHDWPADLPASRKAAVANRLLSPHFVVYEDGRVQRTADWTHQVAEPSWGDVICVGLAAGHTTTRSPETQLDKLDDLIAELGRQYKITAKPIIFKGTSARTRAAGWTARAAELQQRLPQSRISG